MYARVINEHGKHPAILVCEHASAHIPAQFNDLGLSKEALKSHVAWDPGAFETTKAMSEMLDAPLIYNAVSRLVYDCNRPPSSDAAMPHTSETYEIPGNYDLSLTDKQERVENYYRPFEKRLADLLLARDVEPVLVTIHSFTPTYFGKSRSVEIGIVHDEDRRLADVMLKAADGFDIRRNEPYGSDDGVTHTLREHALPHGFLNVMIEIRNDLIVTQGQCQHMAELLSKWLTEALDQLAYSQVGEVVR